MNRTTKLVFSSLLVSISIILGSVFSYYIPLFGFPSVKLSFASIPLVMNGIILGPSYAIIGGIAADTIGFLLNPGGAYFPGFTLNTILWGLLPALIYKYWFNKNIKFNCTIINTILYLTIYFVASYYVVTVDKVEDMVIDNPIKIGMFIVLTIIMLVALISNFMIQKKQKNIGLYSIDKIMFIFICTSVIVSVILTPIWLNILYGIPIIINTSIRVFKQAIEIPIYAYLTYLLFRAIKARL